MQWRIQTRKGGGLKYTPFIFNLELSSMAGEKIKGGSGGAPMEFPGAGGLEPPQPPCWICPCFHLTNIFVKVHIQSNE